VPYRHLHFKSSSVKYINFYIFRKQFIKPKLQFFEYIQMEKKLFQKNSFKMGVLKEGVIGKDAP
jgi:hypothetical protein